MSLETEIQKLTAAVVALTEAFNNGPVLETEQAPPPAAKKRRQKAVTEQPVTEQPVTEQPATPAAPPPVTSTTVEEAPTLVDLQKLGAVLMNSNRQAELKQVANDLGATKLRDLELGQYAEAFKRLKALVGGEA